MASSTGPGDGTYSFWRNTTARLGTPIFVSSGAFDFPALFLFISHALYRHYSRRFGARYASEFGYAMRFV
ncbi:MAG TPA: hypothetical protein VIW67_15185, partial [Terriglobales bacterium]